MKFLVKHVLELARDKFRDFSLGPYLGKWMVDLALELNIKVVENCIRFLMTYNGLKIYLSNKGYVKFTKECLIKIPSEGH